MPSSTPILPEGAPAENQGNTDLEDFKSEMRLLVQQLENKLAAITEKDLVSHREEIQDVKNDAALLEKVTVNSIILCHNIFIFRRWTNCNRVSTSLLSSWNLMPPRWNWFKRTVRNCLRKTRNQPPRPLHRYQESHQSRLRLIWLRMRWLNGSQPK